MKTVAKIVPKTNKMADTIFVILAVRFFMIDFPIDPISGHTTIISHISALVNPFLRKSVATGRCLGKGNKLSFPRLLSQSNSFFWSLGYWFFAGIMIR